MPIDKREILTTIKGCLESAIGAPPLTKGSADQSVDVDRPTHRSTTRFRGRSVA